MNDKQQLQEMGLHLSEQQAKGLADAFAESDFAGALVPMQEGGLCMAKQIEDLQARLQECANGAAKMQEQRDNLADLLYRTELGAGALKRLKSACVVMGISTPESIEELGAYQARYVSMLIDETHDVCGLAHDYDVQRQQLSANLEVANRKIAVMAELLIRCKPYIDDQKDWGRSYEKKLSEDIAGAIIAAATKPEPTK